MFGEETKALEDRLSKLSDKYDRLRSDSDRELRLEKEDHERELKLLIEDHERELKFFVSEEVKEARDEQLRAERACELLKKENTLRKEICDVNGDIIDIKELVEKLIDKLPSIDIKSLNVIGKD